MIEIASSDIDNYNKIGSGKFGTVYQVDKDTAYKLYHTKLFDYSGRLIRNPALKLPKRHFESLKRKGSCLVHTDTLQDVVYVDGKFGGISIPFYDGNILKDLMNENYKLKVDISKQLVRNGKELTDHKIYPLDYKLNNIMYVDGKVKIIDLDDNLTKSTRVYNPLYNRNSIYGLGDTIKTFLNEYDYKPYSHEVREQLERSYWSVCKKYSDIDDNILECRKQNDYLLLNSNRDLDYVIELLNNNRYRIIYTFDKKVFNDLYYLQIINILREKGISLYDFVCKIDIDKMNSNYNIGDCLKVDNKRLIKVPFDK